MRDTCFETGLGNFLSFAAIFVASLLIMNGCATTLHYQMPSAALALPDDLDGYLKNSEAALGNVRPGAEKIIVWNDPVKKNQTPYAIVYLHGFSSSRQEISPVCETVGRNLGANIYFARLNGHGQDGEALGKATLNEWLQDGAEAMAIGHRIGKKVILIGYSTGGTLATWLANQPEFNSNIEAVILISPNFGPKNHLSSLALWPNGQAYVNLIVGKYREWKPRNEAEGRIWTWRYPSTVIVTMMRMVQLVDHEDLKTLKAPFLVIYNPNDQTIDPDKVKACFPQIGSPIKKLVSFDKTQDAWGHLLAGDAISPQSNDAIIKILMDFLKTL